MNRSDYEATFITIIVLIILCFSSGIGFLTSIAYGFLTGSIGLSVALAMFIKYWNKYYK